MPEGTHQVRMEFVYDGGGLGKGGTVSVYIEGEAAGDGRVAAIVPLIYSADETCDIGSDTSSPVSDDYTIEESLSTAPLNRLIDIADAAEEEDHLISPDERLRAAMARQ